MNYFKKIKPVPTFESLILEAVDVYMYELTCDDVHYPEYKFTVPASDINPEYIYTVNLDSGFRGNANDYEVTFYFGEDDGVEDIYSKTNNLGLEHLYSVLATMDAILLDAAAKFPVRDFIVAGEATDRESGNGHKNEAGTRTKAYMRYATRHYPSECVSFEEDTGILRLHAYELPDSVYAKMMAEEELDTEGVILAEGYTIPYNDYSDFRKIVTQDKSEFNVEVKLNDDELEIQINPVPSDIRVFGHPSTMEELFKEIKMMLVNMATSLNGGSEYHIAAVKIASSAIPNESINIEVGKANRVIEHLTDEILFRNSITFKPEYKNGIFYAKCDTTIANLN